MALLVINGVARTFQILCAAVVLGLSITLIRSQSYGTVAANNYAAFTGGFGLLVGLVGAAAIFIEPLAGIVMVAADALAELFLLAGGIVSSFLLSLQNQAPASTIAAPKQIAMVANALIGSRSQTPRHIMQLQIR
ncbi:hypothetical protein BK809_0004682 [Diplodia seriata]|uniref:MARVEL domain-containing protein n=1 Tax=Diplodia seriata TaxID=420778 RepID=A0A1S8B7X6_9PEZI|nr:hypothetical protein BK809_0004682 [Diplodia seriata]